MQSGLLLSLMNFVHEASTKKKINNTLQTQGAFGELYTGKNHTSKHLNEQLTKDN